MNVKISGELRHEFESVRQNLPKGGGDHTEFRSWLLRKNVPEARTSVEMNAPFRQ
jgi:hypothetical protein